MSFEQIRDYGPESTLYFLHIPKTAGSALRTFLQDKFHVDRICPHLEFSALLPQRPSTLRSHRLICGHHGLYLRQMLNAPFEFVTVLREPLSRAISHYRHLKATKDNWLHGWVQDKSFEQFVLSDQGVAELLNFQARYLALDDIQADYFGHSAAHQAGVGALFRKYNDPAMRGRALEWLDRMRVVGTQEQFGDTLRLLCGAFGWPEVAAFPNYNRGIASFSPSEVTDRARARVAELSGFDQELFEAAQRRMAQDLAKLSAGSAHDRYSAAMRGRPRQREVRLGFEAPILGDNWYVREKLGDGSWARWAGPERRTTLDFPLATDRALTLRFFAGAQTMDVIESTKLLVNGEEVRLRWWQMHDPGRAQRTFEATLTPELLRKNEAFCRLEFEVHRTVVPAKEWPGRPDQRSFALYFFWLEVFG